MKKTEIKQVDDKQKAQLLQKLDQDIKKLERLIKNLLDTVDINELNTEKRLIIGARFIALHQRAVALRHAIELDQPENRENLEVTRLMRLMRGEPEIETGDAVRIVDVIDDAGLISPYRETPELEWDASQDD
jgi:hypothetical protein